MTIQGFVPFHCARGFSYACRQASLLFFIQEFFRQGHMKILCQMSEVVRLYRLELIRTHGERLHQNLRRFFSAVCIEPNVKSKSSPAANMP